MHVHAILKVCVCMCGCTQFPRCGCLCASLWVSVWVCICVSISEGVLVCASSCMQACLRVGVCFGASWYVFVCVCGVSLYMSVCICVCVCACVYARAPRCGSLPLSVCVCVCLPLPPIRAVPTAARRRASPPRPAVRTLLPEPGRRLRQTGPTAGEPRLPVYSAPAPAACARAAAGSAAERGVVSPGRGLRRLRLPRAASRPRPGTCSPHAGSPPGLRRVRGVRQGASCTCPRVRTRGATLACHCPSSCVRVTRVRSHRDDRRVQFHEEATRLASHGGAMRAISRPGSKCVTSPGWACLGGEATGMQAAHRKVGTRPGRCVPHVCRVPSMGARRVKIHLCSRACVGNSGQGSVSSTVCASSQAHRGVHVEGASSPIERSDFPGTYDGQVGIDTPVVPWEWVNSWGGAWATGAS